MNRSFPRLLLPVTMALMTLPGCSQSGTGVAAEGIIYSVEYQLEGGRTGGLTRANNSKAVPGGNGSWNVDAYGMLTHDFLIIRYAKRPELGPEVIPVHRLISVQFGDGGIRQVSGAEAVGSGP
jgi:hypothetical protein